MLTKKRILESQHPMCVTGGSNPEIQTDDAVRYLFAGYQLSLGVLVFLKGFLTFQKMEREKKANQMSAFSKVFSA